MVKRGLHQLKSSQLNYENGCCLNEDRCQHLQSNTEVQASLYGFCYSVFVSVVRPRESHGDRANHAEDRNVVRSFPKIRVMTMTVVTHTC